MTRASRPEQSQGPRRTAALPGEGVQRIHWIPGTDRLLAVCFCRTEREFEDPVELWDWLLAHPGTDSDAHDGLVLPYPERDSP
ncbi:hypothetical protein [Streptomyces albidus (ex Kaewkla and Franco 2022)]|uniref:hypothetical protein n=1 Tax=Streptomyces albidus (ex Kaewkla and Franco 2022) TaxID=722709 RepID=UPI0015EE81AD|nr:hypothetical protein [Streptomyces albidus (ex Kaewkla and Franco 2022)]